MIGANFDYITVSCQFTGLTKSSEGKTVVLCDNSATCTTDEILSAYQQYGIECVKHLTGVYSFAIWDSKKESLFVVRDQYGERPMYYAQIPTGVMFSTDLKEILPKIAYPAIRPHELAQPIRHNFPIDMQRTWIEQINRLQPGEYAIVDKKGMQLHTYYKREHTETYAGTRQEALAEALRLMRESVKRCVETAPGPIAVLLSGGIDSSSLAALTKEIQQEVHVISAGYRGNRRTSVDERPVARQFAKEKGLVYHEIELDVNDFQSYLEEMMPYLDEPCFDVNSMVQYALYKKAAEMGFKTILCGLGGDELFYSYAYHHKVVEALQLRNQFYKLYPVRKHRKEYLRFMLRNWKHVLLPNHPVRLDESVPLEWTFNDYCRFAKDAYMEYGGERWRFSEVDVHYSFPQDADINTMYDFMFGPFMMLLCVYMANKMSAANGVEVRFPLLSPDLIRFVDSLPVSMKYNPNAPKQFQKDVMAGIVPNYILYAEKRGFEPPFEFIRSMASRYQYKRIHAEYCFFNSMVADMLIDKML